MEGVVSPTPPSNSSQFPISLKDSPSMSHFLSESFREMNKYFIMLLITFFCTLITLLIAIVHTFYISKYVSLRRLRNNLYYIVALNPVCSTCCLFAMMMPRNLAFLQGIILTYQMIALRISIDILFNISGGRRLLSDQLKACKESIKYKAFPFCCCGCLPVVAPSVRNIRKLENFISQSCRIVLQVADICAMRETGKTHNWWFVSSYVFSFITMTAALYFSFVVFNLNRDTKNKSRYNYLFYMVNISQILYTAQRTVFGGFKHMQTLFSADTEKEPFPMSLIAYDYFIETYYLMFVFSVEMAVMSCIITVTMRPGLSYLFDSYTGRADSIHVQYMKLEKSSRPDKESKKESMKELKGVPIGQDTGTKTLGEETELMKPKLTTAIEDDGNYENLNAESNTTELKKVLKSMEKK